MVGEFYKHALIIAAVFAVFSLPSCSYLSKTSDFDPPEAASAAAEAPSKKIPMPTTADDFGSGKFDQ